MSRSRSSSSSNKSRKSNKQQSNLRDKRRSRSRSSQPRRQVNKQNTCLYIGNLDKRCPEDKLKDICEKYGPFDYCYIVFEPTSHHDRHRDTKISRGYGFVKYKNEADAIKAKQGLSGFEIMSRKVTVEVSNRTKPRQSTPGRYLGRRRSPPREYRDRPYRRRSYSRSSDGEYRRRRRDSRDRERKHRDRDREHKESRRRDRDRSRSGQKKHKKRRQSRSNSPRK